MNDNEINRRINGAKKIMSKTTQKIMCEVDANLFIRKQPSKTSEYDNKIELI